MTRQESKSQVSPSVQVDVRTLLDKLLVEHQVTLLNFALVLFAFSVLVIAVYDYTQGRIQFASILTASGGISIVLLVLSQLTGAKLLKPLQWMFCLILLIDMHLFLFAWNNDAAGILAAVCTIPLLVAVQEVAWSIRLLIINFIIFLVLQSMNPFSNDSNIMATDLWDPFLFAYLVMSSMSLFLEYFRNKNRQKLIAATKKVKPVITLDELSGLPNRREMERHLGTCLNRYFLSEQSFSILSGNLDDFKYLNEKYGHKVGDQFIKDVAKVLQRALRSDDIVARWGGDDFLILLPYQQIDAARQVAERLRKNVSAIKKMVFDEEVHLSISFGVACIDGHENCDELLATADRGLFQAKNMGKDLVVTG